VAAILPASLELPLHMALMAMWEITITCRDSSRLRFSEFRSRAPQKGEIVEMADAGTTIKARIDAYSEERFKASGGCPQAPKAERRSGHRAPV
jgi:hypothetical protein